MSTLLENLQAKAPKRNVVFTAVEELKTDAKIQEFFEQYSNSLVAAGVENADETARGNVGYVIVYYGREVAEMWQKALPQLSHPVSGKSIPWNDPGKAYRAGNCS